MKSPFVFTTLFSLLVACSAATKVSDLSPLHPKPLPSVTLVFSGDLMQHIPQVNAARQIDGTFDYSPVFEKIGALWQSADFTIVNLETTLSDTPPFNGYPMFCSPSAVLKPLKTTGVDVLALANNHCVDRGGKGVTKTLYAIRSEKLSFVGLSDNTKRNPMIFLQKEAFRIAILNYTYGTNGMPEPHGMRVSLIDTTIMRQDYVRARTKGATQVIVFLHWGEEYQIKHNTAQTTLAQWCRKLGVDYIVGSHPHVVQPIDTASRVAYSLGNLVSNQSTPSTTQGGISIRMTIFRNGDIKIGYIPHWVDCADGYIIRPAADTAHCDKKEFRRSLNETRRIIGCDVLEATLTL